MEDPIGTPILASTHLLHVFRLRGRCIPAVVEDENVGPGETLADLVEELLLLGTQGQRSGWGGICVQGLARAQQGHGAHRLHQSGLRVGHQHKHVSVQAELVDPAVQLCGDIDARARGEGTE